MNIITIIDAVDIFLSVLIFVLVVYKATKDKGSLFFLALLGLGATWSLESILDYSGVSVYFVNNCIFATALLILFSLSLFTYYFPQKVKFYNYKLLFVITFIVVFFVIGIFLGGVTTSISVQNNVLIPKPGILYIPYLIFILFFAVLAVINIVSNFIISRGIKKIQLIYISIGLGLSVLVAIITNLILPFIGVHDFNRLGPASILFFDIFVFYTIIRHRFLNLRIIIGNIFYVLLMVLFVNGSFFGTLFLEKVLFKSFFSTQAILFDSIVSIIFAIAIIYLNSRLSYLYVIYTGEKSRNEFIEKMRNSILTNLNLEDTLKKIIKYVDDYFHLGNLYIVIHSEGVQKIFCSDIGFTKYLQENSHDLEEYLSSHDTYITLEEKDIDNTSFPYEILYNFKIILAISIPIDNDNRINFFIHNKNIDSKVFDNSEINFIKIVFHNVSDFISRALLHEKVLDFNKTLQDKIKVATDDLNSKNVELQELYDSEKLTSRKERDMLDIMGHELRTPATVVKMAAYLLDNKVSDERGKEQIVRIKDSIERQIKLINTFINTAKIENNKIELGLEPVELDAMGRHAVEDHTTEAVDKGLSITYEEAGNGIIALADPARIREVVDNLITNAIKYTAKGIIQVSCYKSDSEIVFKVKDTGEGIEKEDQDELFQKFKRVNTYTQSSISTHSQMIRPGGTGLGLYVSKGVIELHKGRIWVESEKGKGSTFYFALPIPKEEDILNYKKPEYKSANMFNKINIEGDLKPFREDE